MTYGYMALGVTMSTARLTDPPEVDASDLGSDGIDEPLPQLAPKAQKRFAEMLGTHFASVWRLGRRLGLPSAVAEELAQEAFLVASRKLELVNKGRERAFLFGVMLRLAANLRRTAAWQREAIAAGNVDSATLDEQPSTDQLVQQKQQRLILDSIFEDMSDQFREVMILFEIEECSLQEIAEALGIPEGTASSRLRRARDDFARRVQRLKANLSHGKELP